MRWGRIGVFNQTFAALGAKGGKHGNLRIDETHLKARRTAVSLLRRGLIPHVLEAGRAT